MELPLLLETEELLNLSDDEAKQSVETLIRSEIGTFCQSFALGNMASIHVSLFEEMDFSVRRTLSKLRGITVTRVFKIDEDHWGINYTYNGTPNSITI